MATRYSDVRRGAELQKALTNYTTYLQNASTRPSKRLQGGSVERTITKKPVSIIPFGVDMPTESPRINVNATLKGLEAVGGVITALGARIDQTVDANARVDKAIVPAKVSYFKPSGTSRSYVQSKITKLYYLKYAGDTYALPFGAETETEEFDEAVREVRAGVLAQHPNLPYRRVSISSEKIRV